MADPRLVAERSLQTLRMRKAILLAAIILTCVPPILFVTLDDLTLELRTYKLLAKVGSLCGTVLLMWQIILGFRLLAARVVPDLLWVLGLHRWLGTVGIPLVMLHPIFITLYYRGARSLNLFAFAKPEWFNAYFAIGLVAAALLLAIGITSVFFIRRMTYRAWYAVHLTSYVMLGAALVHALPIGGTLNTTPLRGAWIVLAVGFGCMLIHRALARLGLWSARYRVTEVRRVARDITEITLEPLGRRMEPCVGQFAYFRPGPLSFARPYTISRFDPETGAVTMTAKALGPTSTRLQHTQSGQVFRVDGPFGVFTQRALLSGRPVVMIAGGVGITPFPRLIDALAADPDRPAVLFYGGPDRDAMAYLDELAGRPGLTLVPVLMDEPGWTGEQGLITVELIQRTVDRPLPECEFLICGPPGLTSSLEHGLSAAGVPRRQLHHEMFVF